MLKRLCLMFLLAVAVVGVSRAETDPSVGSIYEEARSGHVARAIEMMKQVLRDHPQSAKAHYVMAELYAEQASSQRRGRSSTKRSDSRRG